jgi:hypothetical protein
MAIKHISKSSDFLIFPSKKIRAQVIAEFIQSAGYKGAVVFGCGNGAAALRECGVYVIDVSARGEIEARKWWTPAEIKKCWPDLFDATSGHLPAWLMLKIATAFREYLGNIEGGIVPTGSGETITCLRWAFPEKKFTPIYDLDASTKYNENAPLNILVSRYSQGINYTKKQFSDLRASKTHNKK